MRALLHLLISLAALYLIVHGQSLNLKRQSALCPATSVFSASSENLSHPLSSLGNGINDPMLSCTLLDILGSLVDEFHSFMVIHDDSTIAKAVIEVYFSNPKMHTIPIITGEMRKLQSDPDLMYQFFQSHERIALVVVLFLNTEMTKIFLEIASSGGLFGPLILLSLEEANSARELLPQVRSIHHVAFIAPHLSSNGKLKYISTTFLPYSTSKFHSEEIDLDNPMGSNIFVMGDSPNFQGKNFQLASWIDDFPYLFYNNDKEVDGIGIVMLREIAARVNFTFSLQEIPPDGYWGELINGTWVGMLGQVLRKEKDFIINGFAVVLDRYQAADFTVPYFTDSYSITLKVPPPFPRWLSVVYPFNRWVWAAVILALLVLAIIYHILIRNDPNFVYNNKYDVVSTLVWLSRNLLRQSAPKLPSNLGCRAFLACWWIAALVLSTSYMGNLIAFLTVPFQTRRIATLEELGNSKIKIHMLDYGNFVPGFLWSSKEPVLQELGKKLTLLPDYDEIIAAFDNGASVLEASAYSQFLFITRKRIKISYAVEEKLFPNYVAWAFQKGFPYKHVFDRYLERMKHSGLVEYWHHSVVDKFRISAGQVSGSEVSGEKTNLQPLTLDNLQGAFIVVGLGTILAISALICELLTAGVK